MSKTIFEQLHDGTYNFPLNYYCNLRRNKGYTITNALASTLFRYCATAQEFYDRSSKIGNWRDKARKERKGKK